MRSIYLLFFAVRVGPNGFFMKRNAFVETNDNTLVEGSVVVDSFFSDACVSMPTF